MYFMLNSSYACTQLRRICASGVHFQHMHSHRNHKLTMELGMRSSELFHSMYLCYKYPMRTQNLAEVKDMNMKIISGSEQLPFQAYILGAGAA